MQIIEGENVDLLEPFPASQLERLFGWLHCYKTFIETDLSPKTAAAYVEMFTNLPADVRTFGVVDKRQQVDAKVDAALIGMLAFEPASPYNGYMHVASRRKAWGTGLIEEASKLVITELFTSNEQLCRLSAMVFDKNAPAKSLLVRMGFKREGIFPEFVRQNNLPVTIAHYGLTRSSYNESIGVN